MSDLSKYGIRFQAKSSETVTKNSFSYVFQTVSLSGRKLRVTFVSRYIIWDIEILATDRLQIIGGPFFM